MTMKHSLYMCLSLVSAAVACGGTSVIDGGAGGNAASAATTTDTSTNSTSGTGGSGGSASSTSTGQGGNIPTCEGLEKAYAVELELALACDPFIDVPQCTEIVLSDLACQCEVYVNAANGESISKLQALAEEYKKQGCMPNFACDCLPAISGTCQAEGNSGTCVTSG